MTRTIHSFIRGVLDVWHGLSFLMARPSLWIWALLPLLLNVCLFGGCLWLGWHFIGPFIDAHLSGAPLPEAATMMQKLGSWLFTTFGWLAKALFWIIALVAIAYLFIPLATLVASPFNDIISEKVELMYAGERGQKFKLRALAQSIWVSLKTSLWLSALTLVLLALTWPLHLIPGFGSALASVLATMITIWFLSLQFTAYSMDRRFYGVRQRGGFQKRNRARSLGLGSMAFAIMLVPVVNALFIPVFAVAGTILFCDSEILGERG